MIKLIKPTKVFKALADDTRLRIVNLFLKERSLCVCEIVDALRIPQYQISKHLSVLRNAGLLDFEKRGTWAYYFIKIDEPLNRILFSFLGKYLKNEIFQQDIMALENRLILRENGKCIVGLVSQGELLKMIKEKAGQVL
ncbi:MAG: winged helix-turn-helix transcriptional regulator [Deltaproteobacteria bacterium]|nr:winged helix-turn-helix transcriptional regulator [Deltaproteobacteria bacterium]